MLANQSLRDAIVNHAVFWSWLLVTPFREIGFLIMPGVTASTIATRQHQENLEVLKRGIDGIDLLIPRFSTSKIS
jgi:hypothetical protein